jgi:putative ATP-dependent endonuclease of OLD family
MYIRYAEVLNFRALESVSIPLQKFSIILGENDVGKSSFLYALVTFFANKKLLNEDDFFKKNTKKNIDIILTFKDVPGETDFKAIMRKNGDVVIKRTFGFDESPEVKAIMDGGSEKEVNKKILKEWFSSTSFHFIPVRRDLAVQFSMTKTALLGKTLRAKMKNAITNEDGKVSLEEVERILKKSIEGPRGALQSYLQEQMHNNDIKLTFEDLEVDPVEGVKFKVNLSDDRVDGILIQNRGAGTQNNLIIALFRLVANLHVGSYFIFAMEEPENSLHPKAQRQLLSVLQDISKESQVICTTHSPVFLERSKFENNIILNRTTKGNAVAKTFDESMLNKLRTDLGIRPSDALLKGGGNCAILVEGNTEEEAFPIFMEMIGLSEFQLGIAIINLQGSDRKKIAMNTTTLLAAYNIPCILVLDNNRKKVAEDVKNEKNMKAVFCLKKGNIEDYYPLEIVADVINQELKPTTPVKVSDFDATKTGDDRLKNFKHVMFDHGCGDSINFLKKCLGSIGTKMMKEKGIKIDPELKEIFEKVKKVVES